MTSSVTTGAPPTIDREALRRSYREERDKRIRPEGKDQYPQPTGRFSYLLEDPYTPRVEPRSRP